MAFRGTPQSRTLHVTRRGRVRTLSWFLAALLMLAVPFAAAAPGLGIGPGTGSEDAPTTYLVGFHDQVPGRGAGFHGATVRDAHAGAGFAVVAATDAPGFEKRAANDPNIRYLEADAEAEALATPNDPSYRYQWGMHAAPGIDAGPAWDTTYGSTSVIVAVLDSGIDASHPDTGPVLAEYDFVNGDSIGEDDCGGHGTHAAGIVAARADNGIGVAGTAQVSLLNGKVLRLTSEGCKTPWSAVANAIVWATDRGADVITMSLGSQTSTSTAVRDAMAYAYGKGVLITAAAGNYGCYDCVAFPAKEPQAIAVAAHDHTGATASFSSTGPEVELTAPGAAIYGVVPGGYAYKSGTSMATPHVAGVAALVLSHATMTNVDLRDHLKATAVDLGLSTAAQGAGAVNAANAFASLAAPAPAPEPDTTPEPTPEPTYAPTFEVSSNANEWWIEVWVSGDQTPASVAAQVDGGAWVDLPRTDWGSYAKSFYVATGSGVQFRAVASDGSTAYSDMYRWLQAQEPANDAPTASFTTTTSGLAASFDGSGSTDADGDAISHEWYFGDGTTATGASATHTYASAGTYTVTLTVTDSHGAMDQASATVTIEEPAPLNNAPTASFTGSATDLTASFDASGSSDPEGDTLSYAWSFGDGTTGRGIQVTHAYEASGTYTVTLTVTDEQGASDSMSRTLSVQAAPAPEPEPEPEPTPSITLSANGWKDKGRHVVGLAWSGAATSQVVVYRDGSPVATTGNDGHHQDWTGNRGSTTYTYRVCETNGGACSGDVRVSV